jgi:hypothetical protein
MASTFNLNILQGSDFIIKITAYDDDAGIIDLTGYTVQAKAKFRYSSLPDVSIDLGATIPTATVEDGVIDISLTQAETAAFPVFQGIYEVEITKGTIGMKIISGLVNISPQITT